MKAPLTKLTDEQLQRMRRVSVNQAAAAMRKAEKYMRDIDDLDIEIAKRKRERSASLADEAHHQNELTLRMKKLQDECAVLEINLGD